MLTMYLIRHGRTAWNQEGRLQGHQNPPLNAEGVSQAQDVARVLAHVPLRAVYTSDLDRAFETGVIIGKPHCLTPIPDVRMRELKMGEWEGFTQAEIEQRWPREYAAWRRNSLINRPPGGERLEEAQQRVARALGNMLQAHGAGNVAVIGHLGSLRAALAVALDANSAVSQRFRVDHGSVSIITVSEHKNAVTRVNDTCHLTRPTTSLLP